MTWAVSLLIISKNLPFSKILKITKLWPYFKNFEVPLLKFGPIFVMKSLSYLLLTFRRTDRSQFEPKVNSFFMFGVRARSASKPTTSIKSFNDCLTGVEELESEMMSMNVREIFNIVKCCIVREISWMRNWWPRRSSHLIKPKPDLTLRRRGYQYII